jgi:hypothetical protein
VGREGDGRVSFKAVSESSIASLVLVIIREMWRSWGVLQGAREG